MGETSVQLPPLAPVRGYASVDAPVCTVGCAPQYTVKVTSATGAQTLVTITLLEMEVTHYLIQARWGAVHV